MSRKALFDARSVIALVAVVGCFGLGLVSLITQGSAEIPAWAVALVTTIATFFFASKGSEVATENHVNMTDRLYQAEQSIIAGREVAHDQSKRLDRRAADEPALLTNRGDKP